MSKLMTKSELIEKITAEHSDKLTKKDVKGVMETLATIGYKELKKTGAFLVPGFAKVRVCCLSRPGVGYARAKVSVAIADLDHGGFVLVASWRPNSASRILVGWWRGVAWLSAGWGLVVVSAARHRLAGRSVTLQAVGPAAGGVVDARNLDF